MESASIAPLLLSAAGKRTTQCSSAGGHGRLANRTRRMAIKGVIDGVAARRKACGRRTCANRPPRKRTAATTSVGAQGPTSKASPSSVEWHRRPGGPHERRQQARQCRAHARRSDETSEPGHAPAERPGGLGVRWRNKPPPETGGHTHTEQPDGPTGPTAIPPRLAAFTWRMANVTAYPARRDACLLVLRTVSLGPCSLHQDREYRVHQTEVSGRAAEGPKPCGGRPARSESRRRAGRT